MKNCKMPCENSSLRVMLRQDEVLYGFEWYKNEEV